MSEEAFYQFGRDVNYRSNDAFIGHFQEDRHFRSINGVATHPQAAQVTTIAVPGTVDALADYKITENGTTATYTSGAADTQNDLGAGLVAQFNATPGLHKRWTASYTGGVLTITGQAPGITGTFTVNSDETTNDLGAPSIVTTAAFAETVGFGLVCVSQGFVPDEGNEKVYVPTIADFTAQVIGITIVSVAGATFTPTLTFNGKTVTGDAVIHDTSDTVTALAILTEINTLMDANFLAGASVVATQTAGLVTLTAEVPGAEFDANIIAAGAAASATKDLTTGPNLTTSLRNSMAGISVRREDVEDLVITEDNPAYKANSIVVVAREGRGVLQRVLTEVWAMGDPTFISLASADKGTTHNVAAANRVWLASKTLAIERSEPSTQTNGVGYIRLNLGA